MKLGWYVISVVALSWMSNPLWALDFNKEIERQNAKGQMSQLQIQSRALNGMAIKPKVQSRDQAQGEFNVRLQVIKR